MDTVVCGIDPGLGITGYAVVRHAGDDKSIIDAGVCRYTPTDSLEKRLAALQADLSAILDDHQPTILAVESLYAHYKHPRTAILMGHARGVVLLEAGRRNIPVESLAATHVKRHLTGNGRAGKNQVQRAIKATLGLERMPEPPDLADALAIAICCGAKRRENRFREAAR